MTFVEKSMNVLGDSAMLSMSRQSFGSMGVSRKIVLKHIFATKGKEILEQLTKPQFFAGFKVSRSSLLLRSREEKGGIFKLRKKSWF